MGRNYDKSLAAFARSLFFYGTLILVSKNVVNGVPGGKLLFLGYTSPHVLRKQILSFSNLGW